MRNGDDAAMAALEHAIARSEEALRMAQQAGENIDRIADDVQKCLGMLERLESDVRWLRERAISVRPKLDTIPEVAEATVRNFIGKKEVQIYRFMAGAAIAAILGDVVLRLLHH
jgi:hypothetical protein